MNPATRPGRRARKAAEDRRLDAVDAPVRKEAVNRFCFGPFDERDRHDAMTAALQRHYAADFNADAADTVRAVRGAIDTAPEGATVAVRTEALKEIGETLAWALGRTDLAFAAEPAPDLPAGIVEAGHCAVSAAHKPHTWARHPTRACEQLYPRGARQLPPGAKPYWCDGGAPGTPRPGEDTR